MPEQCKEICICAAIKTPSGYIVRGQRHGDCFWTATGIPCITREDIYKAEQGFITSANRFVGRKEGRLLQDAAGIKSADPEGYRGHTLFSEDLY